MKKYTIFVLALYCSLCANAQMSYTGYLMGDNPLSQELNPAFQPEKSYISVPILGNNSFRMRTSMQLDDLIFDTGKDKLTTFMSKGTISKAELMDRVGDGLNCTLDVRLTLLSMGRKVGKNRYQTLEVSFRNNVDLFVAPDVFRSLKDVENGRYDFSGTGVSASSMLGVAVSESRKLNSNLTLGLKARVLFGLAHADLRTKDFYVEMSEDRWVAQGHVAANVSGFDYKNKTVEYKGKEGSYSAVNSLSMDGLGLNGIGLSVDAGAIYDINSSWSLSASVLDFGFVSWYGNTKAENSGERFEFDGFNNVVFDKEAENSIQKQMDRLSDDMMGMINLQDKGRKNDFRMLSATINAGAQYKKGKFTGGALFTARIHGKYSWVEGRLQAGIRPWKWCNLVLSPSYSTYGLAIGGMADFKTKGGCHIFLSSDRLDIYRTNKQFIPKSLCADIQIGMTIPL